MAKGYDKYHERLEAVALLGKDLARRAKRKCEWCEEKDDLRPYDTAPDDEPSLDALVLFCQRCRAVADGRKDDPRTLRFLEGAIWHELPAISEMAKGLVRELDADWARATLEMMEDQSSAEAE